MIKTFLMLIFSTTAASAQTFPPPTKYDHPFKGTTHVKVVNPDKAAELCKARVWGFVPQGCAFWTKSTCTVIVNSAYAAHEASIVRHEVGHCNGWSYRHEP